MRKTQKLQAVLSTALCAVYVLVMVFSTLFHHHLHSRTSTDVLVTEGVALQKITVHHGANDCQACQFLSHQISFESPEIWTPEIKFEKKTTLLFSFEVCNLSTEIFHISSRGPPTERI